MAYRNYYKNNYRSNNRYNGGKRRQSRTTTLTRLAYNMGQVEKGLKNPDSKITASFNQGCTRATTSKKSLF